jgi:hypothetical protein
LLWASLAELLRTVSFVAFFTNLVANDAFWSILGLYTFVLVSLPVYFTTTKSKSNHNHNRNEKFDRPVRVVFSELFKSVYRGVFSDYRLSLISKIPLVVQVLIAGSVLYTIFGLDWIMHALGGFGVGAISLKVYKVGVSVYGYGKLASYFGMDRFESFKTERKYATGEWTLFCLTVITVGWELMERVVYFINPYNTLRIGLELAVNSAGDVVFGVLGGMAAWYILDRKLHWS